MLVQLLTAYQHINMFILPLLGILWGMVYMRYRQESRFVPVLTREHVVMVAHTVFAWRKLAQERFVSAEDRWYAALYGTGGLST